MTNYDICIAGAGVAGAAAGVHLARKGFRVAIADKDWSEQDRIVGELLQPGGVEMLNNLGLSEALEGIDAAPVSGYALFRNEDNFHIGYPGNVTGFGFRNGKFVQNLRRLLQNESNVTCIEGSVTGLLKKNGRISGFSLQDNTGRTTEYNAKLTFVCDGAFSALRSEISENEKKIRSFFGGLILKHAHLPYSGHGHVFVIKPSPVLVYPISSTETRVLIDFPGEQAPRPGAELKQYLMETVCPQLPESVRPCFIEALETTRIKIMPNHIMPARPKLVGGAVMLGDSLNMRHPLTGGGMTVAFTDTWILCSGLNSTRDLEPESLDVHIEKYYRRRPERDATINILADALYGVMSNEDLAGACFRYLKQGGVKSAEPMSLLSAVSRRRSLLIRHFFAVAVEDFVRNVFTLRKINFKMIADAIRIIGPLMANERAHIRKAA
jgi:squalene monooxygenase